jgi:hypothetical protein
MARAAPPQVPPSPTPYRAERMLAADGAVDWWGEPLTEQEAIARLQNGEDVVVRGPKKRGNRDMAMQLASTAWGPGCEEDQPHQGPLALPHFHPPGRTIEVHVFYDSPPQPYARRRREP